MVFKKPLLLQVDSSNDDKASLSIQSYGDELKFVSNSYQEYKFTDKGLQKIAAHPTSRTDKFSQISEQDIQILDPIGEGASATVYKAVHKANSSTVAVKRINCLEKDRRKQIMNDIRGLCNVSHPSLVQFLGAYRVAESNQISIVLEYMDGGSLADLIKKKGKVPEDVLAEISVQVLEGTSYLHRSRHTLHRDIKPANILLSRDGHVKIADFGISAFVDNTLAQCNTFLGTVTYMSPERINSKPYSFSADIWSIGLTLLECALGRYPFDAEAGPLILMMQVLDEKTTLPMESLSRDLRDFLEQCLIRDPHKRPTAHALLSHPFLAQHAKNPSILKDYLAGGLQSMGSKELERSSSGEDEENLVRQANELAQRLFRMLSRGSTSLSALPEMLMPDAVLIHEGVERNGRALILKHMRKVCDLQASLGANEFSIERIDVSSIKADQIALEICGIIKITNAGPLAAAILESSPPSQFLSTLELKNNAQAGCLAITKMTMMHV